MNELKKSSDGSDTTAGLKSVSDPIIDRCARLRYSTPTLRVYGNVAALTNTVGMNGTVSDGGMGSGMSKTS